MFIHGTDNAHVQRNASKITKVILTNESGGSLGVSIFPASLNSGDPVIRLVAADDVTNSQEFNGVEFPDGFTVVPDTNLTYYGIEYDTIKE